MEQRTLVDAWSAEIAYRHERLAADAEAVRRTRQARARAKADRAERRRRPGRADPDGGASGADDRPGRKWGAGRERTPVARSGACGVLLPGEAGMGKSRLVAELGRRATEYGALVLTGRCVDMSEGSLPYLPFSDALAPLAIPKGGELRGVLRSRPALGRLFPQLVQPTPAAADSSPFTVEHETMRRPNAEQDIGQLQLFDAVVHALTELADERLVVLVVEDLHWADSSTRDLLAFLCARLRSQRLLLLATYRHDDVHRRHPLRPLLAELSRAGRVDRMELSALSADDAHAFVTAISDGQLGDTAGNIVRRAEGNAFFLEELVASGAESEHEVPAGLAEVLLARVERLPAVARQLIRVISVAHGGVAHGALSEVAGLDELELEGALREAVQHGVLVVDNGYYAFRHALLREAVYADLLPGERTRMHAAYARRLVGMRRSGVAAQLAYHSFESNDLPTALEASLRAAQEAEALGAPGSALRHIERALRVWDAVPPERRPDDVNELELTRKASRVAGVAGEPDRSISYARAAVAQLAEPSTLQVSGEEAAKIHLRLGRALLGMTASLDEAASVIDRAWDLVADAEPSHTRTWVLAVRARILRGRGKFEESLASAQRALAEARAYDLGGAEADSLITIGRLAEHRGDSTAAREYLRTAQHKAAESHAVGTEMMARYYLGLGYEERGELDEAVAAFDDAVARGASIGAGLTTYGVESRVRQLHLRYVRGQWSGIDAAEPNRNALSSITAASLAGPIAHVLAGQGRFEDALRLVDEMRPHVRVELLIAIAAAAVGTDVACWKGEHSVAVRRAEEGIAWFDEHVPELLACVRVAALGIAAAASHAGGHRLRLDRAGEDDVVGAGERLLGRTRSVLDTRSGEVDPAPGTAIRPVGPEALAWQVRAEAEATRLRGSSDPELWAKAVEAFGYGAVYDQAVCRWRCAEALLDAHDTGPAAEHLAEAHAVAERIGAVPLRDAVRATAARGRVTLAGQQAPRAASTGPLTERERAVLELVALGRTNRQVGAELYISEKTVSVHLSRAMAKLGAGRRAEAVAIAYDRGLLNAE
ncbi:regulatory protein, luxR family [Haloechinothrix alba]|uniref:Regulatory protein, luxR family n=1 Tax=Haloechinothrix alba TaxID=664784 RepID=A0A238VNZ7_9PSEU|nr:helix-turn-helix transcriptional regulator [Haloechinothrix alba]SNR35884.1 regulatory protein, luxR family [Haloechinothrix alba]